MKIKTVVLALLPAMTMVLLYSCQDDPERDALQPDFAADVQVINAGDKVTFDDRSEGSPTKWKWYFDGGTPASSILHSPAVTYAAPGKYNVKLVIGRGSDSTVLTREAFIDVAYPQVAADFGSDKFIVKQGENIAFTDLSMGNPTAWQWKFIPAAGPAVTSSEKNPVIALPVIGKYTVELTASNPKGNDVETKIDYVEIIDPASVNADFTVDVRSTYTGATVTYTDASVGIAETWSWTFEGGTPATSTAQNPTVTYSAPGRYKVTLTAANTTKSSTKEIDDYVLVIPGNNLTAYFPFNGHGDDIGPNHLAPAVQGTAITYTGTDRKAMQNAGAVFAGTGGLIVPDNAAMNFGTTDFSVAVWLKTDKTTRMMVWQESGGAGSGDNQTWMRLNANLTTQLTFFNTEDAAAPGANVAVTEAQRGKMSDNVWHHVVCVRSGSVLTVYVDGVFANANTGATTTENVSNAGPFKIGVQQGFAAGATTYANYFNGTLDDLVVYNKALTAQEVSDLFGL